MSQEAACDMESDCVIIDEDIIKEEIEADAIEVPSQVIHADVVEVPFKAPVKEEPCLAGFSDADQDDDFSPGIKPEFKLEPIYDVKDEMLEPECIEQFNTGLTSLPKDELNPIKRECCVRLERSQAAEEALIKLQRDSVAIKHVKGIIFLDNNPKHCFIRHIKAHTKDDITRQQKKGNCLYLTRKKKKKHTPKKSIRRNDKKYFDILGDAYCESCKAPISRAKFCEVCETERARQLLDSLRTRASFSTKYHAEKPPLLSVTRWR